MMNNQNLHSILVGKRARANISTVQTGRMTSEGYAEVVKKARTAAIEMMAKAGFKIPDNVKVKVDPRLPIMGYTMPPRGRLHHRRFGRCGWLRDASSLDSA